MTDVQDQPSVVSIIALATDLTLRRGQEKPVPTPKSLAPLHVNGKGANFCVLIRSVHCMPYMFSRINNFV